MAVRYEWDDERHIIMNIYLESPWTWAEYHQMMASVMPTIQHLNRPCATVVDCSRLGHLPKDGNFLTILMNVEKAMPENLFVSAVVAAPYGVSVFMNMLMKVRPRAKMRALFCQTMAEAHEKIYALYYELHADVQEGQ